MEDRIEKALDYAHRYAQIDGSHHRLWVIDQMVRSLLGASPDYSGKCEKQRYLNWVREYEDGEDGQSTYKWNTGIAP